MCSICTFSSTERRRSSLSVFSSVSSIDVSCSILSCSPRAMTSCPRPSRRICRRATVSFAVSRSKAASLALTSAASSCSFAATSLPSTSALACPSTRRFSSRSARSSFDLRWSSSCKSLTLASRCSTESAESFSSALCASSSVCLAASCTCDSDSSSARSLMIVASASAASAFAVSDSLL